MIWIIIIGMAIATMIPRIIPTFLVEKLQFRPWINRWLSAIPYAALGALIFPGILTAVGSGNPYIGLAGGIVAVILAYFNLNIIFVVVGAIFTVFMITL